MKKAVPAIVLVVLAVFLIMAPWQKRPTENESAGMPENDEIEKLMEQEFFLTRDPKLNRVPRERLLLAKEVQETKLAQLAATISVPGISWSERGPNNVGGRTRALWFDLNDAPLYRKVWAAGVSGGLWFTNDITIASPVWNKVDDFFDNMAITCLAQDPANPLVMYFGTGEGWFNIDAVQGFGIWKSIDGGASWSRITSTASFFFVQDLLIDNNSNVYASVRPNNSGAGAAGIQKSVNGGTNWAQVLGSPVFGSSSRGADLELAANGDIYASLGTISSNGGVYRSDFAINGVNTGNTGTWVNITPNTTGTIAAPANFWQRIELACAPSNADVVYALFQGNGSANVTSIQRYQPSTNTWALCAVPTIIDQGSNSNFARGQAWYNLIAQVDPNNASSLYIAGIDALRSDDAGATWTQMTTWSLFAAAGFTAAQNVHADQHAITYVPGSSSRAIWGTDGGVYYTTNADITGAGAKPSYVSKNGGYNVTQYYGCAIHPSTTDYFLAGAQDNGSHKFSAAGLGSVTSASGGDGGFPHIDQDNGNVQITSYVNNNYFVSTNGGTSFTTRSKNDRGSFINPTDYDNTANILYAGDDAGNYYRWLTPESNGADQQVSVTEFAGSPVTHVSVSPVTANRVFFGLANGSVVMVDNAHTGTSAAGVVIKPATAGVVSCVAIDPANEDHILVTSSTYGVNQVYESINALSGLPAWTVSDGDLPDMPVRWAMFDPRNADWAILATELGVWSTDNLNGAATNWSPTNSGLANVRVDMLQYRAADRTIAAATHGRGLYTAIVPNVTTPDINFQAASTVATEQTTASSSCRNYRDYNVIMTIANPPTGDATVTVNIQGGNTATQGLDFDFTTNGNFAAASNSFVFSSGVTTPQTVTVRIYDDAEIEATETFTLEYTISGTTDAQAGTGAQTHVFSITDDDVAPTGSANLNATIGIYDVNLTQPFRGQFSDARTQMVYLASELTAAGFTAGTITDVSLAVITKSSTAPYNGFTIKMKNTATATLTGGAFEAGTTTVFGPVNYSTIAGTNTFTLSTPFVWDGTSNLLVEMCYDNATGSATDNVAGTTATPLCQFDRADGVTGCSIANAGFQFGGGGARPVMNFSITTSGTPVAEVLNTSRSEYLGPNSDVYFYSGTGELMARVRNLTAHDYGCTQVVIDRAGTAATQFWNNNTANYLANKTFRVIPANNNPAGQYEITLYFTQGEVNGWQTATGQTFGAIQMIKLPGQILSVTPGTPEPDGVGTVQVVDPSRSTLGANSSISFIFNNGFSGFGAGIPGSTLPVTLLDFTGVLVSNSTVLNWSTSSEHNSKAFEIERSYDGIMYTRIGIVEAAGNSSVKRAYGFTDPDVAQEINYYRLRQVDIDGQAVYSKVLIIKNPGNDQLPFRILNNPVREHIDVQFGIVPAGKVDVRLVDINGKLLFNRQFADVNQRRVRIDISRLQLANAVYVVQVTTGGKTYTQKLLK